MPGDDQPLRLQQREGAGDGAAPGSPPPGVQTIRTNGAYSGTVTFEGCSLGSGGGAEYYRLFTDNSARTFIFSNPAFLDGCGDIAFHATGVALNLTIAGSPGQKASLDPILAGGNALPIRFTGSSLTLRDISVSIRSPATALMDSAFEGPLVSPLTVALERCEFLNGSGTFNLVAATRPQHSRSSRISPWTFTRRTVSGREPARTTSSGPRIPSPGSGGRRVR